MKVPFAESIDGPVGPPDFPVQIDLQRLHWLEADAREPGVQTVGLFGRHFVRREGVAQLLHRADPPFGELVAAKEPQALGDPVVHVRRTGEGAHAQEIEVEVGKRERRVIELAVGGIAFHLGIVESEVLRNTQAIGGEDTARHIGRQHRTATGAKE